MTPPNLKELHYGKVLNLIYSKEYLMVQGPYCVVLLSSGSWLRIDPLEPCSREWFSGEASAGLQINKVNRHGAM